MVESVVRSALVDAIRLSEAEYARDPSSSFSFAEAAAEFAPALYDGRTISDPALRAAWNYADSYFDAKYHGFRDLDGIPWRDAERSLRELVVTLEQGRQIEDKHVLRYR